MICATHTHSGPRLISFAPASLPPLSSERLCARWRSTIANWSTRWSKSPWRRWRRKPGRLAGGEGAVRFAKNRRLGLNPNGPVDHSLPLLRACNAEGKVVAIVVNYACHCTTIIGGSARYHGDWAGAAQECIEAEHPGARCWCASVVRATSTPSRWASPK